MQFLFGSLGGIILMIFVLLGLGALVIFTRFGRGICIGAVILFAALAIYFSTKTLSARNAWSQQVETLTGENAELHDDLVQLRTEAAMLRDEFDRARYGWGRVFRDVRTQGMNDPQGRPVLRANFGLNQGLGRPQRDELPVVHAFRPDPNGGMLYIGRFQAAQPPRENDVILKPTRLVRTARSIQIGNQQYQFPAETELWAPGPYRFREMVPDAYTTRFSSLRSRLTAADEEVADKQKYLETQRELVQVAQRDLDNRLLELGYDRVNLRQVGGLLAAIETEEEQRNAVLEEIDRLRRLLHQSFNRLEELDARNKELVRERAEESLQPPLPVTAQVSGK